MLALVLVSREKEDVSHSGSRSRTLPSGCASAASVRNRREEDADIEHPNAGREGVSGYHTHRKEGGDIADAPAAPPMLTSGDAHTEGEGPARGGGGGEKRERV